MIILYDTIRYQIAKAQYNNPNNTDIKGIKIVMESEEKNYLKNTKAIKEEIFTIEKTLGQQIIQEDQRNNIEKTTKKTKRIKKMTQIIGRATTLIT